MLLRRNPCSASRSAPFPNIPSNRSRPNLVFLTCSSYLTLMCVFHRLRLHFANIALKATVKIKFDHFPKQGTDILSCWPQHWWIKLLQRLLREHLCVAVETSFLSIFTSSFHLKFQRSCVVSTGSVSRFEVRDPFPASRSSPFPNIPSNRSRPDLVFPHLLFLFYIDSDISCSGFIFRAAQLENTNLKSPLIIFEAVRIPSDSSHLWTPLTAVCSHRIDLYWFLL